MNQVDNQLQDVRGGRSQEYLMPLQRLADNMNSRKEVAEVLKNYRIENIQNKYSGEMQSAYQHFDVSSTVCPLGGPLRKRNCPLSVAE